MLKKHDFDFVRDTAAAFRLLMDCYANPGRVNDFRQLCAGLDSADPLALLISIILLDNEVTFEMIGDESIAQEISELTGCERESSGRAEYIFITGTADAEKREELLKNCRRGSFESPNESATLIVCGGDPADGESLTLSGFGLNGDKLISAPAETAAWLRAIGTCNFEYPLGVDVVALCDNKTAFCVPRLVKAVN